MMNRAVIGDRLKIVMRDVTERRLIVADIDIAVIGVFIVFSVAVPDNPRTVSRRLLCEVFFCILVVPANQYEAVRTAVRFSDGNKIRIIISASS